MDGCVVYYTKALQYLALLAVDQLLSRDKYFYGCLNRAKLLMTQNKLHYSLSHIKSSHVPR
jgi:hypothetical protein